MSPAPQHGEPGRRTRVVLAVWLGLAAALSACSGRDTPAASASLITIPARNATAGDTLLTLAPAGAQVVAELDLARLRDNPAVGPVLSALGESDGDIAGVRDLAAPFGGFEQAVIQRADALLLCAYRVGSDEATALILLAGRQLAQLPVVAARGRQVRPARDGAAAVWAVGPDDLLARAEAVVRGEESAMTEDRALLAIRTRAMPAAADSASLRVAARLDFDARVALAARFDLDHVPVAMSLWGDVIDDLAVVAAAEGADLGETRELMSSLKRMVGHLAAVPWVRRNYLHFVLSTIDVTRRGLSARATLVIGPSRLTRLMRRAAGQLATPRQPRP
ncbi:MAG: hypothetical protein AAGC55_13815 [Myxococcota bacterium]